jgi:GNAT superfamily N-acetyltransferase
MPYTIRPLNPDSEREMSTVVVFSLMTLWESRPELRVDPAEVPDFGYKATRTLYEAGIRDPSQRYLIALDDDLQIVGHSIVTLRTGPNGQRVGYFWSRYVVPSARRKGLASRFFEDSMSWFADKEAALAEVHIHVDNKALRSLFTQRGFHAVDRARDRWEYVILRKEL